MSDVTAEQDPRAARKRRLEFASVLLLSLATLASAWGAYQGSLWDGEQIAQEARSAAAGREASVRSVAANQLRALDAALFVQYAAALHNGNPRLVDFLFHRFRPEMKPAMSAWLATHPLTNPDAPASPFTMPAYSLKADEEARRFSEESEQKFREAQHANGTSDYYVLLTVLISVTMFFAGIGPQFEAPRARSILVALGGICLAVGLAILLTLPVARPG